MRVKVIFYSLVLFLVVLSNGGAVNALSPSTPRAASAPLFVLKDSRGDFYGLYVYSLYDRTVLHGLYYSPSLGVLWPTYGFLDGNEMVLWVDGPGTGVYVDSFAVAGEWDFKTMIFTGRWVSFTFPTSYWTGGVQMWLYGVLSTEEGETGLRPWIGQSTVMHSYKDSRGFTWTLYLELGVLYHGVVKLHQTWFAYGFKVGEEMFLWADAPEDPTVHDFIYIGKYSSPQQKYLGVWLDPEGPWTNLVSWWAIP